MAEDTELREMVIEQSAYFTAQLVALKATQKAIVAVMTKDLDERGARYPGHDCAIDGFRAQVEGYVEGLLKELSDQNPSFATEMKRQVEQALGWLSLPKASEESD